MTRLAARLTIFCAAVLMAGLAGNAYAISYSESYTYDLPGGIVTKTDPNGKRIEYRYDALNNLKQVILKDSAGAPSFNFNYDATNQLDDISYPGGAKDFNYDDLDRLTTINTTFGASSTNLIFDYDHLDRLTWITYPGNGEVCYLYDADGRMTRVGRVLPGNSATDCNAANEKTDYVYDSRGRLQTVQFPSGIQRFIQYSATTGQVTTVGYRRANGALIYSDTFDYEPNSVLYRSITRTTPTATEKTTYEYDAWQRLTTITEAGGRRTRYTYDDFGNRLTETITNITNDTATGGNPKAYGDYQYLYGANSNRLSEIRYQAPGNTGFVTEESFLYDNAGRLKTRTRGGVTTNYTFDDRGYLTRVDQPGLTVSYSYDALGVRQSKTVNGVTTYFLTAPIFGLPHVLAELTPDMTIVATYIYAGGQQLKEEPVASDRSRDLYLLHDGIVGSRTHSVDLTGQIQDQYDYDAFGNRSAQTSAATGSYHHYGYTGEETDDETGLVYLRARYYDPTLGRFISADPFWGRLAEPSSQNRYVYVQNSPLVFTDPTGLVVYLTGHDLVPGTGISHAALLIMPSSTISGSLTNGMWSIGQVGPQGGYKDGIASGQIYRTISAGPDAAGFGNLVSTPFRTSDRPGNNKIYDVVLPPSGMSDEDFEAKLIELDQRYTNDAPYDFVRAYLGQFPIESAGWNSNSYISGILSEAGGRWAGPSVGSGVVFPLIENPLPSSYFQGIGTCR